MADKPHPPTLAALAYPAAPIHFQPTQAPSSRSLLPPSPPLLPPTDAASHPATRRLHTPHLRTIHYHPFPPTLPTLSCTVPILLAKSFANANALDTPANGKPLASRTYQNPCPQLPSLIPSTALSSMFPFSYPSLPHTPPAPYQRLPKLLLLLTLIPSPPSHGTLIADLSRLPTSYAAISHFLHPTPPRQLPLHVPHMLH